MHHNFEKKRQALLDDRKVLQSPIDKGTYFPDFDPATAKIRQDKGWHGAAIPDDLRVRFKEPVGSEKLLFFIEISKFHKKWSIFIFVISIKIVGPPS